jgi:peptidoglycan/xylan/chitin deacetylase (PgdA/CDA1 family)
MSDFRWPNGKVLALVPTITWETWPDDLGTPSSVQPTNRPPLPRDSVHKVDMWVLRDHLYAEEEGIWRLMDSFSRLDMRATVFANGLTVETFPDIARELKGGGHAMASEGWIHRYSVQMNEQEERESISKTAQTFERVLGERPRGYISPGHRPTPHTDEILIDEGYYWEASYDQFDRPQVLEVKGAPLVAMPYGLVDYQAYRYDGRSPRELAAMLQDEFETLLEECRRGAAGKMMGYVFHPFLARGYRTRPIFDFLDQAREQNDVWVATRQEVADWVLKDRLDE